MLKATKGMKNTLSYYKYFGWMYPIIKALFPGAACTLAELGQAMINAVAKGYKKQEVEVKDIVALSRR
jgi:hypothetical protein